MRVNRIIVNYNDGEYLPTDKEIRDWARTLLMKMVASKSNAEDSEYIRQKCEDYHKNAEYIIDRLLDHFDFFALEEFLAEQCKDDLADYFLEAHEKEMAENDEHLLKDLENEEYAKAVRGGLR